MIICNSTDSRYYELIPYRMMRGWAFFRVRLWMILKFSMIALMVTDFLIISKHLFLWYASFKWICNYHWCHVLTNKLFAIQKNLYFTGYFSFYVLNLAINQILLLFMKLVQALRVAVCSCLLQQIIPNGYHLKSWLFHFCSRRPLMLDPLQLCEKHLSKFYLFKEIIFWNDCYYGILKA